MPYRVLITQIDNPLGSVLKAEFDRGSFIELVTPSGEVDWADKDQVDGVFASLKPCLVINTCGWSDDGEKATVADTLKPCQILAGLCAEQNSVFIQLSSYRVFKGDKSGFTELDAVEPRDSVGELYVQVEQSTALVPKHIILRLGWMIGWQGNNLLTKILAPLTAGIDAEIVSERRGSPVSHVDVGRVLNAIVKQVSSGSENWGVFHYSSADICTEEELARYILTRLGDSADGQGQIKEVSGSASEPLSAALGYKHLMDCFGIQPRTWKQGVIQEMALWRDNSSLAKGEG